MDKITFATHLHHKVRDIHSIFPTIPIYAINNVNLYRPLSSYGRAYKQVDKIERFDLENNVLFEKLTTEMPTNDDIRYVFAYEEERPTRAIHPHDRYALIFTVATSTQSVREIFNNEEYELPVLVPHDAVTTSHLNMPKHNKQRATFVYVCDREELCRVSTALTEANLHTTVRNVLFDTSLYVVEGLSARHAFVTYSLQYIQDEELRNDMIGITENTKIRIGNTALVEAYKEQKPITTAITQSSINFHHTIIDDFNMDMAESLITEILANPNGSSIIAFKYSLSSTEAEHNSEKVRKHVGKLVEANTAYLVRNSWSKNRPGKDIFIIGGQLLIKNENVKKTIKMLKLYGLSGNDVSIKLPYIYST